MNKKQMLQRIKQRQSKGKGKDHKGKDHKGKDHKGKGKGKGKYKKSNKYYLELVNKGLINLNQSELTELMLFLQFSNNNFKKSLKVKFNNQYVKLINNKAFKQRFAISLSILNKNIKLDKEFKLYQNKVNSELQKANNFYKLFYSELDNKGKLNKIGKVCLLNHKIKINDLMIKANKNNTLINKDYKVNNNTIYKSFNTELFNLNKFKIKDFKYISIKITYFDYSKTFILFDKDNKELNKELDNFNFVYYNLLNYIFDNSIKPYYKELNNNKDNLNKVYDFYTLFNKHSELSNINSKTLNKTEFTNKFFKINKNKVNSDYQRFISNLTFDNPKCLIKIYTTKNNNKHLDKDYLYKQSVNNALNDKIKGLKEYLDNLQSDFIVNSNYSLKFKDYIQFYSLSYDLRIKANANIKRLITEYNLFNYSNIVNNLLDLDFITNLLVNNYFNEYIKISNRITFLDSQKIIVLSNNTTKLIIKGFKTINLNDIKKSFDFDFNNVIFDNNNKIKDKYLNDLYYYLNNLKKGNKNDILKLIEYIQNKKVISNNNSELKEFCLYQNINDNMLLYFDKFNCKLNKHNSKSDKERPIINNWSIHNGKLRLIH